MADKRLDIHLGAPGAEKTQRELKAVAREMEKLRKQSLQDTRDFNVFRRGSMEQNIRDEMAARVRAMRAAAQKEKVGNEVMRRLFGEPQQIAAAVSSVTTGMQQIEAAAAKAEPNVSKFQRALSRIMGGERAERLGTIGGAFGISGTTIAIAAAALAADRGVRSLIDARVEAALTGQDASKMMARRGAEAISNIPIAGLLPKLIMSEIEVQDAQFARERESIKGRREDYQRIVELQVKAKEQTKDINAELQMGADAWAKQKYEANKVLQASQELADRLKATEEGRREAVKLEEAAFTKYMQQIAAIDAAKKQAQADAALGWRIFTDQMTQGARTLIKDNTFTQLFRSGMFSDFSPQNMREAKRQATEDYNRRQLEVEQQTAQWEHAERKRWAESVMRPEERVAQRAMELQKARSMGLVNDEVYRRASRELMAELAGPEIQTVGAQAFSSTGSIALPSARVDPMQQLQAKNLAANTQSAESLKQLETMIGKIAATLQTTGAALGVWN